MSVVTIDWPSWLEPAEFVPTLQKNALTHRSPFGQSPQNYVEPGEYWMFGLTLPRVPRRNPRSQALAALANRISGAAVRLRVPVFSSRKPLGSARGVITLASSAAAGASSVSVTGATAGVNMLSNSGLEFDSNGDGWCDNVAAFTAGTTGSVVPSRVSAAQGMGQRVSASGLGTTDGDRVGGRLQSIDVSAIRGSTLSFAASCVATGVSCELSMALLWYDASDALLSSDRVTTAAPASYARRSVSAAVPATASFVRPAVFAAKASSVGAVALTFDSVQLERAEAPTSWAGYPTLVAGDFIGIGGQLLQVAADKTLNDAGAGTVEVTNRPRVALASGTPVLWRSPTAVMVCTSMLSPRYIGGWLEPMAIDLEEVWDA